MARYEPPFSPEAPAPAGASSPATTGLAEAVGLWILFAVVAVEVLATYTRTPVRELYHVSTGGLGGGTRRMVAFAGFPTALMAIAVLPFVVDRLRARTVMTAAALATILAGSVFWPGMLGDDRLDARPVNVIAVMGVVLALFLLSSVVRRAGFGGWKTRRPGDGIRLAALAILVLIALPWMAADLGLSLDLPLLHSIYLTDQLRSQPSVPGLHVAVHDGHHHGMDGFLMATTAIVLSRAAPLLRSRVLRTASRGFLAFLLAYGLGNVVQDFWTEQIVKRGLTGFELPMVLTPAATWAFGVVVFAAVAFYFTVFRPSGPRVRRKVFVRPEIGLRGKIGHTTA